VEVRKEEDADPLEQYVWDGRYVHSPCLRWRDGNTDGDLDDEGDSVLYYTNDANFNVTALVDASDGAAGAGRVRCTLPAGGAGQDFSRPCRG